MFDLSTLETGKEQRISQFISYGTQILRINEIELKKSLNTGSPRAILHMESQAINNPDFKGYNDAKGQLGKVGIGIYMKTDEQKQDFLRNLLIIGEALGLRDKLTFTGDDFEEIVSKIDETISGGTKYARYTVLGEEYLKQDGKIGIKLFLPRYNFVEPLNTLADESKLVKFDKTNSAHYKVFARPVEDNKSEFPF